MIIKKLYSHFLLTLIMVLFILFSCNNGGDKTLELKKKSSTDHISETFRLQNIIDSSGDQAHLDFSKSELTIIDFWFNICPPCIDEMKQFSEVPAEKKGKISIMSISINQFWI